MHACVCVYVYKEMESYYLLSNTSVSVYVCECVTKLEICMCECLCDECAGRPKAIDLMGPSSHSHLIFTRAAKQFSSFLYRKTNISGKEKEDWSSSEDVGGEGMGRYRGSKGMGRDGKQVQKILIKIHDKQLELLANGGKDFALVIS